MFYDHPQCENISPYVDAYGTKSGIFLFKNIIPEELLNKVEAGLTAQEEEDFKDDRGLISWYRDKVSPPVDGSFELWEFVSEILYPEYVIHPQLGILKTKPGEGNGMFVHADSPGKGMCHLLSQDDRWSTCCELDFGLVAYLGTFTGGEVYYPSINPDGTPKTATNSQEGCFQFKPERGDLVVHSAFEPYAHGVRDVQSGIRYAFATFSVKTIDNPGTFYNYKTPQYFAQIGDKSEKYLLNWGTPLVENPQFTDDKLAIMRESGLENQELAKEFFSDMAKDHK